ncbi:hypothetical protein llap_15071 [Limosa lapponica baueri]|uniref:Uncharacterized protein n=1 Tax=Limosa lapponica baueri TaxID=1758121 RepID=A0A2I0TLJ6_LIMLA|nr:hypothetical protein llap_15071 [Limosa lapponica baueri]
MTVALWLSPYAPRHPRPPTLSYPDINSLTCHFIDASNFNIVVELVLAKDKEQVISIKMRFVKPVIT